MKIVVLCGGFSPERNVSLSSAARITEALKRLRHSVVQVDMFLGLEDYEGTLDGIFDCPPAVSFDGIREAEPDLEAVRASRRLKSGSMFGDRVIELCLRADLVFLALHGSCGEDGRVQAALDLLGVKYTGSGYLGSAVAMDKDLTKRVVAPLGLLTPEWRVYDSEWVDIEKTALSSPLPCVVKPDDSGSSIGVSIARTQRELQDAIAGAVSRGGKFIIERYVEGREIQVAMLGDEALPSIEIRPRSGFYDYRSKYRSGEAEEITPSPIPKEAEERVAALAKKIHKALGLSAYSRSDFIYDAEGSFWFLEINTLPGMTPTSLVPQEAAAAGISYDELCQIIIEKSMEKYR